MSEYIRTTSIFETDETTPADVAVLVEAGVNSIPWKAVASLVDVKYSRAWLIMRRAYLEAHAAGLLVTLPEPKADEPKAAYEVRIGAIMVELRKQDISWGEIAVRTGKPEAYCRSMFNKGGVQKDRGLRIGKGGKFVYGDPTLYLEHRRTEGAVIPVEVKGRPTVDQLLNAEGKTGIKAKVEPQAKVAKPRAPRKPKAVKVA